MMEQSRANAGFTMIELLVSVVIMVFLLVGIGVGMDSGSKVYRDANFETDSALLVESLNYSLTDILRYSQDVFQSGGVYFTNSEYGVRNGCLKVDSGKVVIQRASDVIELVNGGVYPDMEVQNLDVKYFAPEESGTETGYFEISYVVRSLKNDALSKKVNTIVRVAN